MRLWNKTEAFIVLYEAAPDARLYWDAPRDPAGADRPPLALSGPGEGRAAIKRGTEDGHCCTPADSAAPTLARRDRVGGVRPRPHSARGRALVRGERGGVPRAHLDAAARRRAHQAQRRALPGLPPLPLESERRRPRRAPNLHLHQLQGRRRPQQQLDGAEAGAREDAGPFFRLHAGTHAVRHSLLHGSRRLAARALRRGDHRQRLRRCSTCRS